MQIKTSQQREAHFKDELRSFMRRHGAVFTNEVDVQMDEVYEDSGDHDGDLVAAWANFTITPDRC